MKMTSQEYARIIDTMQEVLPEEVTRSDLSRLIATILHGYKVPPKDFPAIFAFAHELILAQPEHTGLEKKQ